MMTIVLISLVIFTLGLIASMNRFGIVESYSRYGLNTERVKSKMQINTWSATTILSALALVPACIELGAESSWQFLCFLVPLNLVVIGFTPDFEASKKIYVIHHIAGYLAGLGCIVLAIFVFGNWLGLIGFLAYFAMVGLITGTLNKCYCLWLELAAYGYMYGTMIARFI